jgi:hypothetical protein
MEGLSYQKEGIGLLPEVLPLLIEHAREVNWRTAPVSPQKDLYEKLLDMGLYQVFTVRKNGVLVGYAGFFVNRHPHYENFVQAVCDVVYVVPSLRSGVGGMLIDFAEKELRVNAILYSVTTGKDYSATLERRGYAKIEHIYAKELT